MNNLEHALKYASEGLHVLPLHNPTGMKRCSCGKPDCDNIGKHPRTQHGYKDATIDLHQIKEWWRIFPSANIGLATGEKSRFVVLDIDIKSNGPASLNELEMKYGSLPETLTVKTGSGGKHYYFRQPQVSIGCRGGLFPGIDVRGNGGYVVAPPSLHAAGDHYEFEGNVDDIAELPDWLLELAITSSISENRETPREIRLGGRNEFFKRLAGLLRRYNFTEQEILSILLQQNKARCVPIETENRVSMVARASMKWPSHDFGFDRHISHFNYMTVDDILAKEYREIDWLVEGRIHQGGASIWAGKPKAGKSTIVRNMSHCIGMGKEFLGFKTKKSRVVYLSLEDDIGPVIKPYLKKIAKEGNKNFVFLSVDSSTPDIEFVPSYENIEKIIEEQSPSLLVIDPMISLLGHHNVDINDLKSSYTFLKKFKRLGDETQTHILFVHHSRKGVELDPTDSGAGSIGLIGAVDNAFFLWKADRMTKLCSLQRIGQGLDESIVEFDHETGLFNLHADSQSYLRKSYKKTLIDILKESANPLTEKELMELLGGKSMDKSIALKDLYYNKEICRSGLGKSKSPYRYYIPNSTLELFEVDGDEI